MNPADATNCLRHQERNVQAKPTQKLNLTVNKDSVSSLKVLELKDVCRCHRLKMSGDKDNLIARVVEHVRAAEMTVFDDDNDNNHELLD